VGCATPRPSPPAALGSAPAIRIERSGARLPAAGVSLETVERDLVAQALARSRGNRTRAARLLGLNRDQIRYRIEKFQLERPPSEANHFFRNRGAGLEAG